MKLGSHGPVDAPFDFHVDDEDRAHHTYIIGQTGTGKSTMLRNMVAHDMNHGFGVALVDPHGDLSRDVVLDIPIGRDDDLIYFNPAYLPAPIGYNPLHGVERDDRAKVAGNIVNAFVSIFGERAVADRSQQILRNSLLALMERPQTTLLSVVRLLTDSDFRGRITAKVSDPVVRSYWLSQFEQYDDRKRDDVISPILNKLDAFFSYPAIRNVLAQPNGSIDFQRVIEERKILILNLAELGDGVDYVLGALIVCGLWAAARSTARRTPFYLYIDEFQHFSSGSIPAILSEARKYKLSLTLAHQFWGQVSEDIKDAVFGNVGTLVAFRTGAIDAPLIAKQFDKTERQLRDLPDHTAYVRPLPPSDAIRIETNPPPLPVRKSTERLIANSLEHFAGERADIEWQINSTFQSRAP